MDPSLVQSVQGTGPGHLSLAIYVVVAVVTMAGTFLGALVGVWRFMRSLSADQDAQTRVLIKAETPSEERVRELVRQEAPPVVLAVLHNGLLDKIGLKMRELLQEHEVREDERLARAIQRVEGDAQEGLESLHGDARRVLEQLARHDRKIEGLRTAVAVAERDIAILMERAHLPKAEPREPDTPPSKP